MRLCVLQCAHTSPVDNYYRDPSPWLPEHTWEHHFVDKASAGSTVVELVRSGRFDAFVNLCDGAHGSVDAGIEVVQTLERLGVAFTGADSGFFEPTREEMKLAAHAYGLATPHYAFADSPSAVELAGRLRFPLLVKHPNGYSSLGMTRASRVTTRAQLRVEAERIIDTYGAALIEEFIEGREFTVLVVEDPEAPDTPIALTPVELRFPPGETFMHFDLKWVDYEDLGWRPVDDPELASRLRAVSRSFFLALAGSGYGRCDIRMDADGGLHLLEINPNCGIFYPPEDPGSADVILRNDPLGYRGFLEKILASARRRRRQRVQRWAVASSADTGHRIFATEALAAGEVVVRGEARPYHLATRRYIARRFDTDRQRRIEHHGVPLSDDLVALWGERPGQWLPIQHSCDPNAWYEGLDLVARRSIAAGETITVDHATRLPGGFEPFACSCGAAACRGEVRPDDWLLPVLRERYGGHVSLAVRHRHSEWDASRATTH